MENNNWNKIEEILPKLEKYKNRKEWIIYFNTIDKIKESIDTLNSKNNISELDKEVYSFIIKISLDDLELEEMKLLKLTDKGDYQGNKAVTELISQLIENYSIMTIC